MTLMDGSAAINVSVVLASGRRFHLSAPASSSVGELKAAAAQAFQNIFGQGFLKLLSVDGRCGALVNNVKNDLL